MLHPSLTLRPLGFVADLVWLSARLEGIGGAVHRLHGLLNAEDLHNNVWYSVPFPRDQFWYDPSNFIFLFIFISISVIFVNIFSSRSCTSDSIASIFVSIVNRPFWPPDSNSPTNTPLFHFSPSIDCNPPPKKITLFGCFVRRGFLIKVIAAVR